MPVEKFRTFDEASLALAGRDDSRNDDAALAARIAALWSMSAGLAAPLACRGVRKFRTISEASADRDRMTIERSHARGGRRT